MLRPLARLATLLAVVPMGCGDTSLCDRRCGPCEVQVSSVIDGDTVALEDGRTVRLLGVDAPEIQWMCHDCCAVTADCAVGSDCLHGDQGAQGDCGIPACFGREAMAHLVQRLVGQVVTLEYDEACTDVFGRTLAYAWVGEEMINADLLERGYASLFVLHPNDRYEELLSAAEMMARNWKPPKGIWSCP